MVPPQGWTDRWKAGGSWGLQYRVLRIGGRGMRERPCLAQLQNWAEGRKGGESGGGLSFQTVPHGLEKNGLASVCRIAPGIAKG